MRTEHRLVLILWRRLTENNYVHYKFPPLGHAKAVALLLSAGASMEIRDEHNYSPLIAAIKREHVDVVDQLVEAGANLNKKTKTGNIN